MSAPERNSKPSARPAKSSSSWNKVSAGKLAPGSSELKAAMTEWGSSQHGHHPIIQRPDLDLFVTRDRKCSEEGTWYSQALTNHICAVWVELEMKTSLWEYSHAYETSCVSS